MREPRRWFLCHSNAGCCSVWLAVLWLLSGTVQRPLTDRRVNEKPPGSWNHESNKT